MSEPEATRDGHVIAVLNDLIRLDRDAIEGYTIAINTIRNHGHREALVAFRHDHTRHVEALGALVRARGGVAPRVSHVGGPLGAAVNSLGAAKASDASVLLAFRAIERQSRDHYRDCANDAHPDDVRLVLQQHAVDEEIHYRWIESSLEDLGYSGEIPDLGIGAASALPVSRDRVSFRLASDEERHEPLG